MKALLSSVILASAMLLTACGGGDSDSSGSETVTKPTTNQTENTSVTGEVVQCSVEGKSISTTKGKQCLYEKPAEKMNVFIKCKTDGMYVDGNISGVGLTETKFVSNTTVINGYTLSCK